jgi:hypothetical protein
MLEKLAATFARPAARARSPVRARHDGRPPPGRRCHRPA